MRRIIRQADRCRYVPGCNGSPATMPRAQAEALLRQDMRDYDAMRALGMLSPGQQPPYIEH